MRRLLVPLTLALVVATGGVALAAAVPGSYRTKPANRNAANYLDFSLVASRSSVTRVVYDLSKARACSNGNSLTDTESGYRYSGGRLGRNGGFTLVGSFTGPSARLTVTVRGKLAGNRATGTVRVNGSFNGGQVSCDSKKLQFTAFRLR